MNEPNQASTSKSNSKDDLFFDDGNRTKCVVADSFNVVRFESLTERKRNNLKETIGGRSPTKMPTQLIHPADDDDSGLDIFFSFIINK